MNQLVLLADVINSRHMPDRAKFQQRLQDAIVHLNSAHSEILLVPLTITLGDEFQAIFSGTRDLLMIPHYLESEFPEQRFRFVFSLGELATPVNYESAIGMDGPVFHLARDMMELAKKNGRHYCFAGAFPEAELLDQILGWIDLERERWKPERHHVYYFRRMGVKQQEIAHKTGISQAAVSQNLQWPGVQHVLKSELVFEKYLRRLLQEDK
jgi:hypothetical protein